MCSDALYNKGRTKAVFSLTPLLIVVLCIHFVTYLFTSPAFTFNHLREYREIQWDRIRMAMEDIETGTVQGRSMKKLKIFISTIFSTTFLLLIQTPCHAAETAFKEIIQDSIYGGLAGTVVGAAVMAFTHKPGDHLEYMAYGAAAGVLGGAAYGYFSSRALVEVDKGKVRFAIPTVMPDIKDSPRNNSVVISAELIKGNF